MNVNLTKEQAKLLSISISACIREETKDMVIAESKGYKTSSYKKPPDETARVKNNYK